LKLNYDEFLISLSKKISLIPSRKNASPYFQNAWEVEDLLRGRQGVEDSPETIKPVMVE
jgi:hypothetical protein